MIILVHVTGIRTKGTGRYLAHFAKPYPALLPFEIILELTKPVGLALRLFGNILAGGVMVSMLSLLPAAITWAPTAVWKLFELFVGWKTCTDPSGLVHLTGFSHSIVGSPSSLS